MSYSEPLKTEGKYRVELVVDEGASEPDNDGQSAVLSLYTQNWSNDVEAKNDEGEEFVRALVHFQEMYGHNHKRGYGDRVLKTFERYLRIFHGTRGFVVREADYRETDYTYIAFDTAKLREEWGTTDEYINSLDEKERTACLAGATLDEWVAWATGDVWGYRIERNVGYTKTWEDGTVEEDAEWIELKDGALWGHYGREWAEEAALEALKLAIENEEK